MAATEEPMPLILLQVVPDRVVCSDDEYFEPAVIAQRDRDVFAEAIEAFEAVPVTFVVLPGMPDVGIGTDREQVGSARSLLFDCYLPE